MNSSEYWVVETFLEFELEGILYPFRLKKGNCFKNRCEH